MMEISDEDILAENQALTASDPVKEIVSPDEGMEEAEDVANVAEATKAPENGQETGGLRWRTEAKDSSRKPVWIIQEKQSLRAV